MTCPCGRPIIKDQYFAESAEAYAKRLASGRCRAKCARTFPVMKEKPTPSLPPFRANYKAEVREVPKETTPRDPAYLDFIRAHDCVGCGWPAHMGHIEAHHLRTGGMAIKGSDYETVSLCGFDARGCHAKADKSPESVQAYLPYSLLFNKLWVAAGHKLKGGK